MAEIINNNPKRLFATFRNRVLTGLLIVIPMGLTIWITYFIYEKITAWSVDLVMRFSDEQPPYVEQFIRVFSLFVIIFGLFCVGQLAKYALGRRLILVTEILMLKVPMLNKVYSTVRQIGDAIWSSKGSMFRQVVLIEFPRKGTYTIGFLTNENKAKWEIGEKTGLNLVSVYVPTTPNPTGGYLIFVPREECIFLDMDVSSGMSLVVSCGAVLPSMHTKTVAPVPAASGKNENTPPK